METGSWQLRHTCLAVSLTVSLHTFLAEALVAVATPRIYTQCSLLALKRSLSSMPATRTMDLMLPLRHLGVWCLQPEHDLTRRLAAVSERLG